VKAGATKDTIEIKAKAIKDCSVFLALYAAQDKAFLINSAQNISTHYDNELYPCV
jgi:hypothetical protein